MRIALDKQKELPARFLALGFIVAFILLFWPTFLWMAERFDAHDSFYSHGWLIPVASAWLIWQRREALKSIAPHDSFYGMLLLVPAVIVHILASWWKVGFLSGFSMIFVVWALVWTIFGFQVLQILRFPMLFLLFMVPVPGVLLIATSFHMKMIAAGLASRCINLMGINAIHSGSTIYVPGIAVVVDDTCSGLRSLISLIALSVLWLELMPKSSKAWQKLALVACSIPIALIANMVRIVMLVILSAIYGPKIADSFIHYGSGIVVFGIAILALAWLSKLLVGKTNV